jgi:signal transduction histidine kinase
MVMTTGKKELLKQLPFDIAARLPLQLGRDSIGSSTAAITELIKNAYDANAENVRVSFLKRSAPVSRIQIEDDGDGMNLETVEKVWLRIGTEHKTTDAHSSGKRRVLTGAKGLGRLGIDRLCERAILQTKTEEMDHVIEVHINWRRYTKKDATISGVTHKVFKSPFVQNGARGDFFATKNKGTRLILIGMKEGWGDKRINELKSELSLLVSPFSAINDFSIEVRSGATGVDGPIGSAKVLDAAAWTLDAAIDEAGMVTATYRHTPTGFVHHLDPIAWKDWLPDRGQAPQCGALELKIYYIPQPGSEFSTSVTRKDWGSFMDLQHGVRIYRDQFRVRPYGEPTGRGDWLSLGLRKTSSPGGIKQGGWKVAPRQIVGAVFISRLRNKCLDDQANREGMVETEGFFDLRAFAIKIIGNFEEIATDQARKLSAENPIEELEKRLDETLLKSKSAVEVLSRELGSSEGPSAESIAVQLEKVKELVEETKRASEEHREAYASKRIELEREKDTLANLASLGILTVCFGHEAQEFCNLAAVAAVELKETFVAGKFMVAPDVESILLEDLDTIIDSTKFIKSYAAFSLGNVSKEKRRKGPVNLFGVAHRVVLALEETLNRQNIRVDLTDMSNVVVAPNSYEIDWESIFVNLISNSVWAMSRTPAASRLIKISAGVLGDDVEVSFKDSGCGLEKGTEKFIFNPMYSTRRDDKGNVIGTGMGLSIVNTFVSEHSGGVVEANAHCDLGGAEFVIRIPKGGRS